MPSPINTRFFEQPGFDILYGTWAEVFERKPDGNFLVTAKDAVTMIRGARLAAIAEGLTTKDSFSLESVACRYAQEIPLRFAEVPTYG